MDAGSLDWCAKCLEEKKKFDTSKRGLGLNYTPTVILKNVRLFLISESTQHPSQALKRAKKTRMADSRA